MEGYEKPRVSYFNPNEICWVGAYCYTRGEYDAKLIAEWTRDKYFDKHLSAIKPFDNSVRRARQRQQLSKIMRGQEHYDISFETARCKGAAWFFD
jgi:hypothetical protein